MTAAHHETPDLTELRRLAEAATPGPWRDEMMQGQGLTLTAIIAAAVLDALADRHHHTSLHDAADRLQRCAHICWRQQRPPREEEETCS